MYVIFILGRFRTSSTCIHENHLLKEVRLVCPSKGVTFKDERLAFVPAQGAPCVIFSTIPYSRTVRTARYVHKFFNNRLIVNITSVKITIFFIVFDQSVLQHLFTFVLPNNYWC